MTETEAHIAFLEGEITTAESQGAKGIALGFERAAGHLRQQSARIAELEEALEFCRDVSDTSLDHWVDEDEHRDWYAQYSGALRGIHQTSAAVLGGATE